MGNKHLFFKGNPVWGNAIGGENYSAMKNLVSFLIIVTVLCGCCKDKEEDICVSNAFQIQPFVETTTKYRCNGDEEYTYVLRTKRQIDSLEPNCFSTAPLAFPVDDTSMAYVIVGRLSYHNKDTFLMEALLKDTCTKKVTFALSMIQRDTIVNCCPYGIGAVMNFFCSVENIPADYEVEVKYKYVPLPQ